MKRSDLRIMYKIVGASMLGLLAIALLPSGLGQSETSGVDIYGSSTLVVQDEMGNPVFKQIIHNQLFDAGEDFILDQTFADAVASVADATAIGAVCLGEGTAPTLETTDAAGFETASTIVTGAGALNCIETGDATTTASIATLGPFTFTAGTNLVAADTINFIGVCSQTGVDPHAACSGTLFAVVDTSDVTLNGVETAQITYTFNLVSAST